MNIKIEIPIENNRPSVPLLSREDVKFLTKIGNRNIIIHSSMIFKHHINGDNYIMYTYGKNGEREWNGYKIDDINPNATFETMSYDVAYMPSVLIQKYLMSGGIYDSED